MNIEGAWHSRVLSRYFLKVCLEVSGSRWKIVFAVAETGN